MAFVTSTEYLYNEQSESQIISADWLPPNQELYINKKVKLGNVDPIDLVSYMDSEFQVTELET